jgi:hypothetical protein
VTDTAATPKKTVTFRRGQHSRQKFYGGGLTFDHNDAFTNVVLEDDSAFEDTKNDELAAFFSSLQPGDIVGVIGDLLVVPEDYNFSPAVDRVILNEFTGGTIKKPQAKDKAEIIWKNNAELGIYYRAGFVEHLYRDGVATDGGQTMEIDEEALKESLKRSIEQAKAAQTSAANPQPSQTTTP